MRGGVCSPDILAGFSIFPIGQAWLTLLEESSDDFLCVPNPWSRYTKECEPLDYVVWEPKPQGQRPQRKRRLKINNCANVTIAIIPSCPPSVVLTKHASIGLVGLLKPL